MKFTTDGLIIKTTNVGESDRAVVVLTRHKGLMSAFVSGARKPKSRNGTATALLTFSNLTVTENKGVSRITESETNEVFFGLRTDVEKYSLAQYICELFSVLVPYGVEDEEFLRLALNSLHFLANDKLDVYSIKAITELKLMAISGFMPDLVGCRECGSDQNFPLFLDINGGDMVCSACKPNISGDFSELGKTTLAAARHIVYSDFGRLYSFSLPIEHAKYLSHVTERFLLAQTGHKFKTLDFFHNTTTAVKDL